MGKVGHQFVRFITALALIGAVGLALLPIRDAGDSIAIGLLLAVPLTIASAAWGPAIGSLSAVGTFFLYDLVFVRPYGSLAIGDAKNASPLAAYVLVAVVFGLIVNSRRRSRAADRRRAREARHLVDVIGKLATNQPLGEMLTELVRIVRDTFGLEGVELLLESSSGFDSAASCGTPIETSELRLVTPIGGSPRSLGSVAVEGRHIIGVPLAASGQAIGLLVCSGRRIEQERLGALRAYGAQAAFAIERSRLRERALESALLREVDTWRNALLGAVSHDLRTPLATVKAAVSDLRNDVVDLSELDRSELLELIETQADRLDRLVANLLDMTRIEFGELELRIETTSVDKLVAESLDAFGSAPWVRRVKVSLPADLPTVSVDHVLIGQVLVNLLENAERYAPEGTTIDVVARREGEHVEVAIEDRGPGVPEAERERVFKLFKRFSGGGRAGLGLAIVDAFIAAHGESVRAEARPGGGARFVFTLPVAEV
jgi:two-component system, OmpR family, sensor histidine kinase KdpD